MQCVEGLSFKEKRKASLDGKCIREWADVFTAMVQVGGSADQGEDSGKELDSEGFEENKMFGSAR